LHCPIGEKAHWRVPVFWLGGMWWGTNRDPQRRAEKLQMITLIALIALIALNA
jgi:hypothetical protein